MSFTTSYKSKGLESMITALVKLYQPRTVVEFGTQQGHSAILIAKAMEYGKVQTYDLFEERYSLPPYGKTHASVHKALKNVGKSGQAFKINVYQKDAFKVKPKMVDMLHIDICNHYWNVYPLLADWFTKVKKVIILEGGVKNKWQKKCGFSSFEGIFNEGWLKEDFYITVFKGKKGYALTVLVRK